MSDRHVVQKNFTKLLENYRSSVLPEVISNWSEMSEDEEKNLETVNGFFVVYTLLWMLADIAEITLRSLDTLLYEDQLVGTLAHGGYSKGGESGTVRLVRTLYKSV